MSRTVHVKQTPEARAAHDAASYKRKIEARDRARELRQSLRELGKPIEFWLIDVPVALAALD